MLRVCFFVLFYSCLVFASPEDLLEHPSGFIEGTIIHTSSGPDTVQSIRINDELISYDLQTQSIVHKKVLQVHRSIVWQVAEIVVNGESLYLKPEHRFYVPESSEWISCRELQENMRVLLKIDSHPVTIERIVIHDWGNTTLYDIAVEDTASYFIGEQGILAQSFLFEPAISSWQLGASGGMFIAVPERIVPRDRIAADTNPERMFFPQHLAVGSDHCAVSAALSQPTTANSQRRCIDVRVSEPRAFIYRENPQGGGREPSSQPPLGPQIINQLMRQSERHYIDRECDDPEDCDLDERRYVERRSANPQNCALHERHKIELRKIMEKPLVEDLELQENINQLYRENGTIGNGSSAAAVRYEIEFARPVKGKFHTSKAEQRLKAIEGWLKRNPTAKAGDRAAAENVISDLREALER